MKTLCEMLAWSTHWYPIKSLPGRVSFQMFIHSSSASPIFHANPSTAELATQCFSRLSSESNTLSRIWANSLLEKWDLSRIIIYHPLAVSPAHRVSLHTTMGNLVWKSDTSCHYVIFFSSLQWHRLNKLPSIVLFSSNVKSCLGKESPIPTCFLWCTTKVDPKSLLALISLQPAICPALNHSLCARFFFSSPSKDGR